jgi:hypothetical protein
MSEVYLPSEAVKHPKAFFLAPASARQLENEIWMQPWKKHAF